MEDQNRVDEVEAALRRELEELRELVQRFIEGRKAVDRDAAVVELRGSLSEALGQVADLADRNAQLAGRLAVVEDSLRRAVDGSGARRNGVDGDQPIDGQMDGYWIAPGDSVPAVQPLYEPTGALLLGEGGEGFLLGLSLVRRGMRQNYFPVSTSAVLTYAHTTGMCDGETWKFAVYGHGGRYEPCSGILSVVYDCIPPLQEVSVQELGETFGEGVAVRAREDDFPTIVFRVKENEQTSRC